MEKHEFNNYPEMTSDRYQELLDNISKGWLDIYPITLYQDKILDGWNRQCACDDLGITPTYVTFNGNDLEALQYVITSNIRRDLCTYDKGVAALGHKEIYERLAKERMLAGKKDPTPTLAEGEVRDKLAEEARISHQPKQTFLLYHLIY